MRDGKKIIPASSKRRREAKRTKRHQPNSSRICEECGREFGTHQALNSHKWRAHTEEGRAHNNAPRGKKKPPWNAGKSGYHLSPIILRHCEFCGKQFDITRSIFAKVCSRKCLKALAEQKKNGALAESGNAPAR